MDHQIRISKSHFHIYILQSEVDGTFYVGYTADVEKRLKQHNAGRSTYTNKHRPYRLIYTETFIAKMDAKNRERYIKKYGNIRGFLKSRVPPRIHNSGD
ncbi:hypothetical protein A3A84_00610 [Candidatus Collierbacteria bacterium RIFCSPLOWO2_01_FULL_50_23]|uniref:GIY-YIG domain-containing protein n=2 Tax=Candidatus Collieribacteriota TaxID=1752725 RepID=A0A1F5ETZ3_9BACT|nr:MAG: hypothetical protein A3D09_02415 [Candidatus Collierbacteria bacterium RIFCSPHIGHO2_02_FULL_49_10]OGD72012.1 MAG: hypothetical protein A2703_03745 [Candidatus Collierbacteria bacterium RIFCSPHIGHO2_01_FULL_50_25]OGD74841.1 MAG: hypothetical protein A3A84_00610 [Candidatus Collierbacteria bacterium RIFCSPLOWO2_01_FULL_50_23]